MGMYTEVFFRAEVDEEAAVTLKAAIEDRLTPVGSHPFFKKDRVRNGFFFWCSSYYFPSANHRVVEYDESAKAWFVSFRSNLKNYDGEIEAFFDWITPHVLHMDGEFIGYSLYEEVREPTLYYAERP